MADSQSIARFLNPWTLHLQKLGLELKCPLCLKLLNKPVLLPCNHLFCNFCVPDSTQCGSECPLCKHQFADQDMRPAPYIENMVSIYQSLDAAFTANVSMSLNSAVGRSTEQSPVSASSAQGKSSKDMQADKGVVSKPCLNKGLMQKDGHMMLLKCENGSKPLPTSVSNDGRPLADEMDVNQLPQGPQQSPVSYISSDDNKDVDGNTCELAYMDLGVGKTVANVSVVDGKDTTTSEIRCRSRDDDASLGRDTKRQKKLNYRLSEMDGQIGGNMEHIVGGCAAAVPDSSLDNKAAICAFCKSSKATDVTGPMLFYANGKEVVDSNPDAVPAHRRCIDWTPQVYYDGEIIKNFKSELARSAKLKCNICGLKGAALGCYMKSCQRTYHMPCAFGMQECRWDLDNFLMLCPSHKSNRFPNEKPKSRKCATVEKPIKSSEKATEKSNFWATSPDGPKEFVLCGSALSSEDKYILVMFAKMCGATVSKLWTPNVTHVVASTDTEGACTRTLKVLMAVLGGKWILTMDWVKACMEANCHVNEEPYEITLDNHGCSDGPKTGRLRASTKAPKLFAGLKFYISGDFLAPYLKDLLQLIEVAGGAIVESKEQLITDPTCLIVYNCDPPRGCLPEEESSILQQRFEEAYDIAKQIGCLAIKHTWILESIAGCKLVPFVC